MCCEQGLVYELFNPFLYLPRGGERKGNYSLKGVPKSHTIFLVDSRVIKKLINFILGSILIVVLDITLSSVVRVLLLVAWGV